MANVFERGLRGVDAWQQRHRVPSVIFAVFKKMGDDQAGYLIALLAYYSFLATFPLLLALTNITEIVLHNNPHLRQQLLNSALSEFPIIGPDLSSETHSGGSNFGLVIGLVGAVIGARGLANVVQQVLNTVWSVPRVHRPGFPFNYLRSLALLALLAVGAVLTAATTAFAGLGRAFGLSGDGVHAIAVVLTTIVYIGLFLLAFRVATARTVRTRDMLLAAILSGIAWEALLNFGGILAAHYLSHAQELSGYFGTVLGLIAWLALQATVTVYAVQIDVVRAKHLWPRSILQPPLTRADRRYLRDSAQVETRRPEQHINVEFDDSTSQPPA